MDQTAARTPIHLWIVGVVSLLWNSIGAFDYTMTQTHNVAYLRDVAKMTPEQIDYFASFPAFEVALWAFGVWGALAGSALLILRSRFAVPAFLVSLLGLIGSTFWQMSMSATPPEFKTPGMIAFTGVLWAIAIALLVYARAMKARGVLR